MQSFQRDLEKFERLEAQILGVSSDSMETHMKFAKEYDISFPLITDSEKQIKNVYGSSRITYLIDKKGIIRFIQKGVPENKDFLRELKKLSREPGSVSSNKTYEK
jgi:peroxiredoxin Q/BCP